MLRWTLMFGHGLHSPINRVLAPTSAHVTQKTMKNSASALLQIPALEDNGTPLAIVRLP